MRREEILFDAITGVREELVEEAQDYLFARRTPWRRYAGLAACLLLAVLVGFHGLLGGRRGSGSDGGPSLNASGLPPADTAPQSPDSGGSGTGSAAPEPSAITFTALVLEIYPDRLLVEPDDGFGAERVVVPTEGLAELPDLQAGDRVRVTCSDCAAETDPAAASGVTEIALLPQRDGG